MVVSVSDNNLLIPAQAEPVGRVELPFTLSQLAELASHLHGLHAGHDPGPVEPEQACVRVLAQAPLVDLQTAQVADGAVAAVAAGQAVVAATEPGALAVKVTASAAWGRGRKLVVLSLEAAAAHSSSVVPGKVLAVEPLELMLGRLLLVLLHWHRPVVLGPEYLRFNLSLKVLNPTLSL